MRFGIFYEMQLPEPWAPEISVVRASVAQAQINVTREAGNA